ncbi:MAG: site-2 protease family protein [Parachlamydiales bacterium]|jgi:putative peptide zinc metalloprotease protein
MTSIFFSSETPLPAFRQDLQVFRGPDEKDGYPSYSLFDPIMGQYFRLSWSELTIMKALKPGMTPELLHEYLLANTTLKPTIEQLKMFFESAGARHLLDVKLSSEHFYLQAVRKKGNWFWWVLMHYLYFRLHLTNPSSFLKRTLPYVSFLATKTMFVLYAILTIYGLSLIFSKWDTYFATLLYFFSVSGALAYGLAIILVKIIHELAHAYTAAYFNVRVPSMGVAFIVMWPVLYTDVTDGWQLRKRSERFFISAAGIIAETIIAGLATIGWSFSEPGIFQSMCFIVSTSSWASTLMINLNPAMRFDGYFLLSDMWGIDNLQERAFRYTRWKLRYLFLGVDMPNPEEELAESHAFGLIVYTIYTWIYRFILYAVIAVFVYYAFTKALGIFLFILEVAVFILWPLFSEIKDSARLWKMFHLGKRQKIIWGIIGLILAWIVLPLPHQESATGVVVPTELEGVYVPEASKVKNVNAKINDPVEKDQTLVSLDSTPLNLYLKELEAQMELIQKQIDTLEATEDKKSYVPGKQAELSTTKEKYIGAKERMNNLEIKAKSSGELYQWNRYMYPGQYLEGGTLIGKIADIKDLKIVTLIPEILLNKIQVGYSATFWVPSTEGYYPGEVTKIEPFRTDNLKYPQLASIYHGEIATVEKNSRLELVDTYYTVEVKLNPAQKLPIGTIGYIRWHGPFSSLLYDWIKKVRSIVVRESGF